MPRRLRSRADIKEHIDIRSLRMKVATVLSTRRGKALTVRYTHCPYQEAHRTVKDDHNCSYLMWTTDGRSIVFQFFKSDAFHVLVARSRRRRQFESEPVYPAVGTYSQDGRRFGIWRERMEIRMRLACDSPARRTSSRRQKLISTQFGDLDARSPLWMASAWPGCNVAAPLRSG